LQHTPRNFRGKLCDGAFDLVPGGGELGSDTLFRSGDFGGSLAALLLQERRSLVEQFLAGRFLLGVNLGTRLP
jgi:hypothetical protein